MSMRCATWTPTSDSGAEPASIQSASRACTVPSIRCRAAPNDLKIAPWRMSVPTATFASKLNSRIRIGVISEPPPMPVMPTSTPTSRPGERELPGHDFCGRLTFGSCASGIGHETNGLPVTRQSSLNASQPVQKPVAAASSASAATSRPSAAPRIGAPSA